MANNISIECNLDLGLDMEVSICQKRYKVYRSKGIGIKERKICCNKLKRGVEVRTGGGWRGAWMEKDVKCSGFNF
jgi:hypothetical protein